MAYHDGLLAVKQFYPFQRWKEKRQYGLEQYTDENCDTTKDIFDNLISGLIALGQKAPENDKVELFKIAVLSLNSLNEQEDGLIETGEREDLCELIDKITLASGLNPSDYADGERIADVWREW
jgi:hypothetical protein